MPVTIENGAGVVTTFLSGEIDHHNAKNIREAIDEAIEREHPSELVLDFRNVTFMDSSGIGLVIGRYQAMQHIDGHLTVRGASHHIRKVMRLASIDRLARIE